MKKHPQLKTGVTFYDSILKGLKYLGVDKNEHTFKHIFINGMNKQIFLSDFETLSLIPCKSI